MRLQPLISIQYNGNLGPTMRVSTGSDVKKKPVRKIKYLRKDKTLINCDLQNLIPRNTATDSENFVTTVDRKQKLHPSEVKTAILQPNDLYFRNCCTLMWIKLSVRAPLRRGKNKDRRGLLNQQDTPQPC